MQTHYDIIIIWAWRAGLFTSIESSVCLSKLILEKNKSPWVKILLSGWERANVSNIDIIPERDYFGQNKKALISMFKKFNHFDIISFFTENKINIIEEDRWRLILESWDSKELLNLLLKKAKENNTKIECNNEVVDIMKTISSLKPLHTYENNKKNLFEIITQNWAKYTCNKIVITTWWKSFSQVGTTGDWYKWAKKFGHKIITPYRRLCWLVSKKDLSEISWVSCELKLEVITPLQFPPIKGESIVAPLQFPPIKGESIVIPLHRGRLGGKKIIYTETWPLLFTHFWVSGPIIFNTTVALWEFINNLDLTEFISKLDFSKIPENEKIDYITRSFIKENIILKFIFNLEKTPKRVVKFFNLDENNFEIYLELQDFRTWKEAKVTWGWIKIDELTNSLESKLVPWLYFAWEIIDITGKTWWFNLQFAWTSWNIVGKSL